MHSKIKLNTHLLRTATDEALINFVLTDDKTGLGEFPKLGGFEPAMQLLDGLTCTEEAPHHFLALIPRITVVVRNIEAILDGGLA